MFSRVFVLLRYDCCACPTYKVINIASFVVCFPLHFAVQKGKKKVGGGGVVEGKKMGIFPLFFALIPPQRKHTSFCLKIVHHNRSGSH